MRRIALIAGLVLLAGLGWLLVFRQAAPETASPSTSRPAHVVSPGVPVSNAGADRTPPVDARPLTAEVLAAEFPIVAPLNRPDSTVARDLETIAHVLDAWRSNFPRDGNPFGENADITAALAGENSLGLVLIPRRHPAINAAGELCDRWGTPFRFHQISGQHMEIRSAGPDRKFATADDAIWNPAP